MIKGSVSQKKMLENFLYLLEIERNFGLPTKDTKNQVEHKKWSHHDERDKEDPVEHTAEGIVGLEQNNKIANYLIST